MNVWVRVLCSFCENSLPQEARRQVDEANAHASQLASELASCPSAAQLEELKRQISALKARPPLPCASSCQPLCSGLYRRDPDAFDVGVGMTFTQGRAARTVTCSVACQLRRPQPPHSCTWQPGP